MKIKLSILLLFVSFVILFSLPSCTKDTTTTITKTDTVIAASLTKSQILVQKSPWKIEQIVQDLGGTVTEYDRGGTNTTGQNFDIVRFTFNADGSGSNTDGDGNVFSMTWQFTNADQNAIALVINANPVVTGTWTLVTITDSTISQTNTATQGALESATLVPVNN